MITLPNFLSFLRIPLALLFLFPSASIRIIAILGAMMTDFFDGFLARRYNMLSRVGTTLDPMADKFFVGVALLTIYLEGEISALDALAMISRDISVALFGLYLILMRQWDNYQFRAIWCGKISTTLQLFVLLALTLHYPVPDWIYSLFIFLGFLALGELKLALSRQS